jgi:hypothetical protein
LDGGRKGHDRSRWLNSPNVYQKVEILETGTPDPKKITKWVAEGSPTHSSTPVKIDGALQFVPKGTNPKEFKQKQQQVNWSDDKIASKLIRIFVADQRLQKSRQDLGRAAVAHPRRCDMGRSAQNARRHRHPNG